MLSEAVATRLSLGQAAAASMSSPAADGHAVPLSLERLAPRTESGSLVQAVFKVKGAGPALHSGSVVSVELPGSGTTQLSLPAAAVLPAKEQGAASVMVFNAVRGRVEKRRVALAGVVLPDGRLPVTAGLGPGELVVVAGAAFLTDGEAAVRLPSQTVLSEAR
jgi:hypothetical protein